MDVIITSFNNNNRGVILGVVDPAPIRFVESDIVVFPLESLDRSLIKVMDIH